MYMCVCACVCYTNVSNFFNGSLSSLTITYGRELRCQNQSVN